jgi:chromosomal replication initiation ATPase DnaA
MDNVQPSQIAVYTTMKILLLIRKKQGLECMDEFIEMYARAVERRHPELKEVLADILIERSTEGFYQSVIQIEKGGGD